MPGALLDVRICAMLAEGLTVDNARGFHSNGAQVLAVQDTVDATVRVIKTIGGARRAATGAPALVASDRAAHVAVVVGAVDAGDAVAALARGTWASPANLPPPWWGHHVKNSHSYARSGPTKMVRVEWGHRSSRRLTKGTMARVSAQQVVDRW